MKKKPERKRTLADDLRLVELLILTHSTPPRKQGKYKGHGETDTLAWIIRLAEFVMREQKKRKGSFDGNMAAAARLGQILVTWYCNVHRAKTMDPNRPLGLRRTAYRRLSAYRASLRPRVCMKTA